MNHTIELRAQTPQESVETSAGVVVYLLGLGIAFASAGQAVLLLIDLGSKNEGSMQALAGLMLIAGCLVFGISTLRYRFDPTRLELPTQNITGSWLIGQGIRSTPWLWIAGVVSLAALGLFAIRGENFLVVLLWLVSILTLFISQFRAGNLAVPHVQKAERLYWVGLAIILVVTLVTRVYHLTTLPYNLDGDFADVGLQARALATGQQQQIFAFGWANIPILGYLPAWLGMKLFGTGLAGLNASGVIEGLLMIVGVYLLGRDLFRARVGLFAAALLTVSYTHLAASRQSVYIDPVVFMLFAIYFLLIGLSEGRGWAVVVSGLLSALCLQLYYSGRLVFPIIGFLLLFLLIFHRTWLRTRLSLVLLWVLAMLVTLGPMLLVFLRSPDAIISRTREVFILNPVMIDRTQQMFRVNTLPAMLLEQAHRTVLLFHYYPDRGTQFALQLPFLDPFTATLFTLGLGYAICHWRNLGSWLLLSWTVLDLVIGCFLTINPPFWPRLMVLLPPCALLAAIALNLLYEFLRRSFIGINGRLASPVSLAVLFLLISSLITVNAPLWLRLVILLPTSALLAFIALTFLLELFHRNYIWMNDRLAPVASMAVMLLLIGVGWQNWNVYVLMKGSYATPRTFIGRYLAEQSPALQAHLVSSVFGYKDREFRFLAPGHLVDNLTPEQVEASILPPNSTKMLILSAEENEVVDRLQEIYPKMVVETHPGNSLGEVAFYVVYLP